MMLQNFTTTEISKYPAHVDEPNVVETALNIYEGELNPGFFRYPAGHMNMLALIFKICSIFKYDINKENSYKIAWFFSNVLIAWISSMIFIICNHLGSYIFGLTGGFLSMLSTILIKHSQYAIVDVSLSFFCTLFFTVTIIWLTKSILSKNKIFFLSFLIGLAVSIKYTGALLILPQILIIYYFIGKNPEFEGTKPFQLISTATLGLGILITIFSFYIYKDLIIQELTGLTTDGIIEIEYYNILNNFIILSSLLGLGLLLINYLIKVERIDEGGKFFSPLLLKSVLIISTSFCIFSPYTILEIETAFADFMYENRHMKIGSAAHYHQLSEKYQSIIQNSDKMYPIRFYQTLLISNFGMLGLFLAVIGIYEILIHRKLAGAIILLFCFSMLFTITSWQNAAERYTLSFLPMIYVLIPFGMHSICTFLDKRTFNYNYCLTIVILITGFESIVKWINLIG